MQGMQAFREWRRKSLKSLKAVRQNVGSRLANGKPIRRGPCAPGDATFFAEALILRRALVRSEGMAKVRKPAERGKPCRGSRSSAASAQGRSPAVVVEAALSLAAKR